MRIWSLLAAGVCAVSGCETGWPGTPRVSVPPNTGEGFVRIRPKTPRGLSLQALLTANRFQVHHVNMRLFRQSDSGTWLNEPVAVRLGLPPENLNAPVGLGTLKFGVVYRLELEAYSAASENSTTLISDPVGSRVTFQMPSPALNGTVLSVERRIVFSAPLVLINKPYEGTANYSLSINHPQVNQVRLELVTAQGVVASRQYSRPQAPTVGTLGNLKLGTTYTLRAIGQRGAGNNAEPLSSTSVTFTTPTLTASGTVETGPFGPFTLNLN